jgi:hypothetical protein
VRGSSFFVNRSPCAAYSEHENFAFSDMLINAFYEVVFIAFFVIC